MGGSFDSEPDFPPFDLIDWARAQSRRLDEMLAASDPIWPLLLQPIRNLICLFESTPSSALLCDAVREMMICENCLAFLRLCLDAEEPNHARDNCHDEILCLIKEITVHIPLFSEPPLCAEICNVLIDSLVDLHPPDRNRNTPRILDILGNIFLDCRDDPDFLSEFIIGGNHTRLLSLLDDANSDNVFGCLSRLVHSAPESDAESTLSGLTISLLSLTDKRLDGLVF